MSIAPFISRAQRLLLALMLVACVVMAAVLIRLRERAHDRLQTPSDNAPQHIEVSNEPAEEVTLLVPNDLDDSLTEIKHNISLPHDENARARVLIEHLTEAFAARGSTHPIAVTAGVEDVFLMPAPGAENGADHASHDQLAVVDLNAAFAGAQPSGIEPETLTLLSILATLHANLPTITQVRFLVDGQQRETLAGHADLTRTYLASETNPEPVR